MLNGIVILGAFLIRKLEKGCSTGFKVKRRKM